MKKKSSNFLNQCNFVTVFRMDIVKILKISVFNKNFLPPKIRKITEYD